MASLQNDVVSLYNELLDPACQNAMVITESLMQFYKHESSFEVLKWIVLNTANDLIKRHAAIGIKTYLKYNWLENSDKNSIYTSLLDLSVYSGSQRVRSLIVDCIQTLLDPNFAIQTYQFLQNASTNNDNLETCFKLLTFLISYGDFIEIDDEWCTNLVNLGLSINDSSTNVVTLRFALNKYNLENEEEEGSKAGHYFETAINVFRRLALSGDYSIQSELASLLVFIIQQTPPYINIEQTLSICLDIIRDSSLKIECRYWSQIVCDEVIASYSNEIAEADLYEVIFSAYFNFASENINENDAFDLSNHNVFATVATEFSKEPAFLEYLWEQFQNMKHDEVASYVFLTVFLYTFENGSDFYVEKLNEISKFLIDALTSNFCCSVTASAAAISELSIGVKGSILEVSDELIAALLAIIAQEPLPELLFALSQILNNLEQSDSVFDDCYSLLTNSLQVCDQHLLIFQNLCNLIKRSEERVRHFYDSLYSLFIEVISSDSDSHNLIKPVAVCSMSYLAQSCIRQFEEHAQSFAQFCYSSLESEDSLLVYESMRAIGRIASYFSKQISTTLNDILKKLLVVASHSIEPPQSNVEDEFAGDEDEELDNAYTNLTKNVGTAFRVTCYLMKSYPDILYDHIEHVLQSLESLVTNGQGVSTCLNDCAKGSNFIISALSNLGQSPNEMKIVVRISQQMVEILINSIEPTIKDLVYETIGDIIAFFGVLPITTQIDPILLSIKDLFDQILDPEIEFLGYTVSHCDNAQRILREIMCSMGSSSFSIVKEFIEPVNQFLMTKNSHLKDLGLQFFGDLLFTCSQFLDEEFVSNIFVLAENAIKERNSPFGFTVIKQMATVAPEALAPHISIVMKMISQKLNRSNKKTETIMSLQDNAVTALGAIAMNILKDKFDFNTYAPLALSAMPAQLEVEENQDIMTFFNWLLEKSNGRLVQDFASVLIRLFSDPLEKLEEYYISKEMLSELVPCFHNLIGKVSRPEELCKKVCNNDEYKLEFVYNILQ